MTENPHRFEQTVLPHLDAAFNLARWLTRNDQDAQDVVQDAVLRALRYFDAFRGGDARPWLLAIVRNACFTWLHANRPTELVSAGDDQTAATIDSLPAGDDTNPQALAIRNMDKKLINEAIAALPPTFREVLILRELEDLSYREIALVADVPIGTVMSRLGRARRLLAQSLGVIATASDPKRVHE